MSPSGHAILVYQYDEVPASNQSRLPLPLSRMNAKAPIKKTDFLNA